MKDIMFAIKPLNSSLALTAHCFGLMWFVNLSSPYIQIALARPDTPSFIYLLLLLLAIFFLSLGKGLIKIQVNSFPLPFYFYLALAFVCFSSFLLFSYQADSDLLSIFAQFSAVVLPIFFLRGKRLLSILLSWILFGMVMFGFFLVWQSITGYIPPWYKFSYYSHNVGEFIRAGAGFGEKNYSASLLTVSLFLPLCLRSLGLIRPFVSSLSFVSILLGIIATFSRSAILAALITFFVFIVSQKKYFFARFLFFVLAILCVSSFLPDLIDRFSIISNDSQALSRLDQVSGAFSALNLDKSVFTLFFGVGPSFVVNTLTVHNTFIGLLVEMGLLAFGLWLLTAFNIFNAVCALSRKGYSFPLLSFIPFIISTAFLRLELDRSFFLMLLIIIAETSLYRQSVLEMG